MSFLIVYNGQHRRVERKSRRVEKNVLKFYINWLLALRESQKFMSQFKLMVCNPLLGYLAEIILVIV